MPTKIFVGNVAVNTARESMLQLFQRFGYVTECDVLGNYAFVVRITVYANICAAVFDASYYLSCFIFFRSLYLVVSV